MLDNSNNSMNNTQKRDIQYSFVATCSNPRLTEIIDDDWRKERFNDLDIILASNTVQRKLNIDQGDDEAQQRMPITEVREWNDLGLPELIGSYTENAQNNKDLLSNIR